MQDSLQFNVVMWKYKKLLFSKFLSQGFNLVLIQSCFSQHCNRRGKSLGILEIHVSLSILCHIYIYSVPFISLHVTRSLAKIH